MAGERLPGLVRDRKELSSPWGCDLLGASPCLHGAWSFVEPGVLKLAINSLLDTSDSQVFMACFRRAALNRTADPKPEFPDARLNRFKGIFYRFVIHGAAPCPFALQLEDE